MKRRVREDEVRERGVTRLTMRQLMLRPLEKAGALTLEVFTQGLRRTMLDQHRFALARDVEIHERNAKLREISGLAQQPAIDLHLRPMQVAVIPRHALEIAPIGLELF